MKEQAEFIVLLIGRASQLVYSLVAVRLMTFVLGPFEIGRMYLVLTVFYLFSLIFVSPVANYVASQCIKWDRSRRLTNGLMRFGVYLGIVTVLAALLVLVVGRTVGIGTRINEIWLTGFTAAYLLINNLVTTLLTVLNTTGHRGRFVFLSSLSSWCGLGAAFVLVICLGAEAEHWLEGLLLGQILVSLLCIATFQRLGETVRREPGASGGFSFTLRHAIVFSWPLVVANGFYWVNLSGYRVLLAYITDEKTIGLVVTGLSLAIAPLNIVDILFTEYYRPIFYRKVVDGDDMSMALAWNEYSRLYLPAIILVGGAIGSSGPFLARILVSEDFQGVGWLARWGAVIQAGYMVYGACVSLAFAMSRTRGLMVSNFLGAVVTCLGIYVLGHRWPLGGTGAALASGIVATMVSTWLTLRRKMKIRVPWRGLCHGGVLSIPVIAGLEAVRRMSPVVSSLWAVLILGVAGCYTLLGLYVLARQELRPHRYFE